MSGRMLRNTQLTRQMKRLPAVLRKSMIYDRGSEMACHPELARRLKIDIWFCDPHAPLSADCKRNRLPGNAWQRGSNENTNGQLAPVLPQGHRPWAPSARPNSTTSPA
jgi:IS30 family transposase